MSPCHLAPPSPRRCWAFRRLILAFTLVVFAFPARAAEKYGNSLDWVPADVTFYSSGLRFKEQIDIVKGSKAWEKFRSIPSVAQAWEMAEAQVNNPFGPAGIVLQVLQSPENQQLLHMFGDMFSQETVVYGGPKMIDCLELFQLVNAAQRRGTLKAVRAVQDGDDDDSEAQARAVMKTLQDHKHLIKIPELVVAFKLSDKQAAEAQLQRLQEFADVMLQQTELAGRLEREKIGDAEFLTLKLDGNLVPWKELPWDDLEQTEGEFSDLREVLQDLTLVISLGVRENYLIFSIAGSNDHLAKLGQGSLLADVKEFAPLAKFRDRKLVSLGYLSETLAKHSQMSSTDVDQMVEQVGGVLTIAGITDEKLKDRIAADIEKLGDDLKASIPKPGASMSFCFMTDSGYEGYAYDWTEQRILDSSKPLELANHVGGNSILSVVSRTKYDPQQYDMLVKWVKVGFNYFEEFAIPKMNAEESEKATKALEVAKPLLARADKATREYLLPALKDGQNALVLDAQISSKQWHKEMPASSAALPMAELALVMGVSDAKAFKQAMSEYKAIADELIKKIREIDPDSIPSDYQVPSPTSEAGQGGTIYTYKLPEDAGLDSQIAPSGGVGEHVAVFSSSPKLAARVLAENPPKSSQGLIGSVVGKPCATLVAFNWAALVDAAAPWVEFAIRQNAADSAEAGAAEDSPSVADILSQVRTGMEILKCWKSIECVTTVENGVTISHHVTTFKDLE